MKIVPVLDLLDGVVVRGVAGRRDKYRPVQSCLAATADPLTVARAFRDKLGLSELYVADLDAIMRERPNLALYRALAADGFHILVDAGLRDVRQGCSIAESGAAGLIAGLETIPGPVHVHRLCAEFGPDRVLFSLDLQNGKPLGRLEPWNTTDPFEIAVQAVEAGVTRVIVLDLAAVGVSAGVETLALCRRLIEHFGNLGVMTGGGVRGSDDLRTLAQAGLAGVLVASALHTGAIGRCEIEAVS